MCFKSAATHLLVFLLHKPDGNIMQNAMEQDKICSDYAYRYYTYMLTERDSLLRTAMGITSHKHQQAYLELLADKEKRPVIGHQNQSQLFPPERC